MSQSNSPFQQPKSPNIALFPLRFACGWSEYPRKVGFASALVLILLRLLIGWHFYTEGSSKFTSGGFDSSYFLRAASGPYAHHYHDMIWDYDGKLRLNAEDAISRFAWYRDAIGDHYGFSENQRARAEAVREHCENQLNYIFAINADDIREIEFGRDRIADLEKTPERQDVASLKGQRETIEAEWWGKLNPILADIDICWGNLERDMNAIADDEQLRNGHFPLPLPGRKLGDSIMMNSVIPWFDCAIGACLLLGLFTPVVALAAAAFLVSVFLSQYPPAGGPGSTYYQLIEAMACLTLAATGAGRFAGLDSLIHARLFPADDNSTKG